MEILCLMGLFPDEYREEIEKQSIYGVQYAADKLQWGIVRGLDAIEGVSVTIANSLYIGSYPKRYKTLMIPTFSFQHKEGAKDINIGFCNFSVVKWFSRYYSIKKTIDQWAKAPSSRQKVLLVYALTTPFAQVVNYVNKKYKDVKVCVVVPDLPEYMNPGKMKSDLAYRTAKRVETYLIKRSVRKAECFVLLTDAMKDWFDGEITYTVVEGIASNSGNEDALVCNEENTSNIRSILYAGGINEEYGVVDLVKAFIEVDQPGWELVIYGSGPADKTIKNIADKHPSVKVMGMAPNQEVVKAQRKASVLVNPRKNQIFTRYSFPSKILEYMSSGTPVLAYKLDGMPQEYEGYFYRIQEGETGLEDALKNVMRLTEAERREMGRKAKHFVKDEKNPKTQCMKIIKMLESL